MLLAITCATGIATLLGGVFALYARDRFHAIIGLSAGAVVGVAFFDLVPEAIDLLGGDAHRTLALVALGFVAYLMLDRLFGLHEHADDGPESGQIAGVSAGSSRKGWLGAGSLSAHSFLDGVAIGLSFQVSVAIGAVVAVAVLAHDISDGINTVTVVLRNGGGRSLATRFLLLDAAAPVLGIVATRFFALPEAALGAILAVFGGFFLYIGASDLIPESHHAHPTRWTTLMTVIGVVAMYVIIRVAG